MYCSSYFSIKRHFHWNISNVQNTFFLYRLKLIQCFNFQSLEYIAWLGSSWRSGVPFKLLQPQVTLSLEHFQCSTFICQIILCFKKENEFKWIHKIFHKTLIILYTELATQRHHLFKRQENKTIKH